MMNAIRFPITVFLALAVVFVAELLYFFPQLPEPVASHFDADGYPDGWMSRTMFVLTMMFVLLISAVSTIGVASLQQKMPDSINIPNKAYWLAPERQEETYSIIGATIIWVGCAVLALVAVVTYAICIFNIEGGRTLSIPMIPILVGFFGVVAFIVGRMILRFRRESNSSIPGS